VAVDDAGVPPVRSSCTAGPLESTVSALQPGAGHLKSPYYQAPALQPGAN